MVALIRILEMCILVVLFSIQIYLSVVIYPENRKLFEECQWKILCEKGILENDPECEIYLKQRQISIVNITI